MWLPTELGKEWCASSKSYPLTSPPSSFFIFFNLLLFFFKVRKGRCLLIGISLQKWCNLNSHNGYGIYKNCTLITCRLLLRQNAVAQSKANTELGFHAKYLQVLDERY